MKVFSHRKVLLCATALLLAGTVAIAQSPAASRTVKPREASSGHASGRQDQLPKASGAKSLGSAHATESLDAHAPSGAAERGGMDHAKTNPLYKPTEQSGANPLHESKDKTVSPPNAGAPRAAQYKDPEDMNTRYRPGNNKTAIKNIKTKGSDPSTH